VSDPVARGADVPGARAPGRAVDVHQHHVPASLRASLEERARHDAAFARQFATVLTDFAEALADVDGRLRQMDAAGVEVAVLAAPPPAAEAVPVERRAALAAAVNDELLALAEKHPGRFAIALCLPLPDAAAAVAEVRRVGSAGAAEAVSLLAHLDGVAVDDDAFDELYGSCAAAGLPVLLHPALDPIAPAFGDWNLASAIGAPVETTLAAARLALGGTLDRHPALDVVVPHLGGLVPFLFQRLEDQASPGEAAHPLSHYWRERFYYDTCSFHAPALACAIDSVGAERLLLGSDYPFRGGVARAVDDLSVLGHGERALVAAANAARWFGGGSRGNGGSERDRDKRDRDKRDREKEENGG